MRSLVLLVALEYYMLVVLLNVSPAYYFWCIFGGARLSV